MTKSKNWGGSRRGAGRPKKVEKFFLVSDWKSLANNAEVWVPELLNNPQWVTIKKELDRRTEECGVTEFIRQVGEKLREKIETESEK